MKVLIVQINKKSYVGQSMKPARACMLLGLLKGESERRYNSYQKHQLDFALNGLSKLSY